jgi:hypothetical protein
MLGSDSDVTNSATTGAASRYSFSARHVGAKSVYCLLFSANGVLPVRTMDARVRLSPWA